MNPLNNTPKHIPLFFIEAAETDLSFKIFIILSVSVILALAITHLSHSQDAPIVKTRLGKVQGHYLTSNEGNTYNAFEGVPYALSPVNERRFKDPEPIEKPWSDVLLTNQFPQPCVNGHNYFAPSGNTSDIEDCLYLNVYAPTNITNKQLPVIFYIHGASFFYSVLFGNEHIYLIDYDVIFVTANYRMGAFGFLSTEDNVVPGNMGLKDQVMALRWINKNIKYFGGDPKQVALFGYSCGAQSIHYHYLSPLTTGLFQVGVSISGTAFSPLAQAEESRQKAIKLGELLDCRTDDINNMVNCLRERPVSDIVNAQDYFQPWYFTEYTPFGPVVEKSGKKAFIDRSPIDIIRSGDAHPIPWINGVTSDEGIYPAGFLLNETVMEDLDKNWETIAPHLLNYDYTVPKDQHANVARKIRQYYFGDKPINKENHLNLTNLLSDRLFVTSAVMATKEQAKANAAPVWFYRYSYKGSDSFSVVFSGSTENFGVSHGDDLSLVLSIPNVFSKKTAKDLAMFTEMIKYWLSVAYKRKPEFGPIWTEVSPMESDSITYLSMAGPENFKLETSDKLGELKFWETLNINENKPKTII